MSMNQLESWEFQDSRPAAVKGYQISGAQPIRSYLTQAAIMSMATLSGSHGSRRSFRSNGCRHTLDRLSSAPPRRHCVCADLDLTLATSYEIHVDNYVSCWSLVGPYQCAESHSQAFKLHQQVLSLRMQITLGQN